jgi:outer membrane protein assembly factor BamB
MTRLCFRSTGSDDRGRQRGARLVALLARLAAASAAAAALSGALAFESWPQFRGSDCGVAAGPAHPERWSKTENVKWVAEVPGRGWSSPIVSGGRVFLTSAISAAGLKEPSTGLFGNDYAEELIRSGVPEAEAHRRVIERDIETSSQPSQTVQRMVYCLDAATGKLLWEHQADDSVPPGGRHRKNTYASGTPVTDGERVFAYFGNLGVFAYSIDGQPLWSWRMQPSLIYLDFGDGASPALHEDLLFINNDNEEDCYIVALDTRDGREVWKKKRQQRSGWSTPLVWRNRERTELVTIGARSIISYDPRSGDELWTMKLGNTVCTTPVATREMLYLGVGSVNDPRQPLMAIRPGATGEVPVPAEDERSTFVAWRLEKGGPYVPSPLLVGERLYVLYDKGFLAAFDAADGQRLWRERIGTGGVTFTSSPWSSGGRLYCLSEDGDTYVYDAAAESCTLLATNSLNEFCMATPAVVDGRLFLRTMTKLYCIGG